MNTRLIAKTFLFEGLSYKMTNKDKADGLHEKLKKKGMSIFI
jgi:hypothetical protein